MKTYQGSCHCGAVRFEINAAIEHVRACNCSVCHRRGALNVRVEKDDLVMHTPMEALSLYQWGTRTGADYFCPTCGILPFRKPSALTPEEVLEGMVPFEGWAVNARCLEGNDLSEVPVVPVDGAKLNV